MMKMPDPVEFVTATIIALIVIMIGYGYHLHAVLACVGYIVGALYVTYLKPRL